jgi:fanconi-associated nuclease 1
MGQSVLNFHSKSKAKDKTNSYRQTTLPFTHAKKGLSCQQSQERRLMQVALKMLGNLPFQFDWLETDIYSGRSVRINTELYWLVVRLNVIYERSIEYPKSFLVPSLLTSFKKRTYPQYSYNRDPTIWATRQDLLDYVEALRLEAAIELEMQGRPEQTDLKTPIPGSGKPSATPVPRTRATPFRTPLNSIDPSHETATPLPANEESGMDPPGTENETEVNNPKAVRALAIKELFDCRIWPRWKELLETKDGQPMEDRTPGLVRFEPGKLRQLIATLRNAHSILQRLCLHPDVQQASGGTSYFEGS